MRGSSRHNYFNPNPGMPTIEIVAHDAKSAYLVRVAKSAVLGFPRLVLSQLYGRGTRPHCAAVVFLYLLGERLRQENKNAASEAPFQDRRTLHH